MTKSVLITGSSKGIGKAIAELVSKEYEVIIHCARSVKEAKELCKKIIDNGGKSRFLKFDVSNFEECNEVLSYDIKENGIYYGVVCNAGITKDNLFPLLSKESWNEVISVNLNSFYNVLKPIVMPMVQAKKGGRIITIASISGITGNKGQTNYSASKSGIIGATKSLALELASRNITVNCIAPGLIETKMTNKLPLDEIIKQIPMQRIGKPYEVASLVLYLLSDGASYITKQVISVNGGLM